MKNVEEFLKNKGVISEGYEVPSVSTVEKSFYVSNPYQGVTLPRMQLHAVQVISQRQVHKLHINEHACNLIGRITKDRVFALSEDSIG